MFVQIKINEMKTILIPTDLSTRSLDLIKNAILNFPNEKLNIILAYGLKSHVSDFEPMNFLSARNTSTTINKEFVDMKNKLYLEHRNQLVKIRIEAFTGMNSFAFKNFLIANKVTQAVVPKTSFDNLPSKHQFDLRDLILEHVDQLIMVDSPGSIDSNNSFKFKVSSILQHIKL